MAQTLATQTVQHGQHIFIYSNIRTNQVVYSLTRALNNNEALKQLPFVGKKTVPARLRKDLWQPFAMVEFPRSIQGLVAYRKLREFRRLHETAYPLETVTQTEGPHKGQMMGKKQRGKVLMNQKANSVADLAAVLLQQEKEPSQVEIERAERRIANFERLKRQRGGKKVKKPPVSPTDMAGVEGVRVRWVNQFDAEYAETWPAGVIHDSLQKSRYTAVFPPWVEESSSGNQKNENSRDENAEQVGQEQQGDQNLQKSQKDVQERNDIAASNEASGLVRPLSKSQTRAVEI